MLSPLSSITQKLILIMLFGIMVYFCSLAWYFMERTYQLPPCQPTHWERHNEAR